MTIPSRRLYEAPSRAKSGCAPLPGRTGKRGAMVRSRYLTLVESGPLGLGTSQSLETCRGGPPYDVRCYTRTIHRLDHLLSRRERVPGTPYHCSVPFVASTSGAYSIIVGLICQEFSLRPALSTPVIGQRAFERLQIPPSEQARVHEQRVQVINVDSVVEPSGNPAALVVAAKKPFSERAE